MELIQINVDEIDARATARFVLFGSSDGGEESAGAESDVSISGREHKGSKHGLLAVLLGIGLAVWLSRRR